MKLTWYGHAAFLVEAPNVRIILDPFRSPDSGGYEPINDHANVVVISHENDRYHSHLGQIQPPFEIICAYELPPRGIYYRDVHFQAIRVFETPEKLPEDEVTIIYFEVEGLKIVFLGDLGHPLNDQEIAPLKNADVLLAAAGGPPTIDFPEIPPLIEALQPKIIIPMHYKTPRINLDIQPVERFLDVLPHYPVKVLQSSSVDIHKDTVPQSTEIWRMQHAR